MADAKTDNQQIEEIIWAGFPEGHTALRNPRFLAGAVESFLASQPPRSLSELATDPIVINHLAYRMARPGERLKDEIVEIYCDLAAYVLRALAMAE